MIKIGVDILGFENEPKQAIDACYDFCSTNNDVQIILVGKQADLINYQENNQISFWFCENFFSQDDNVFSIRNKKDTSLEKCCDLLKENKVDTIVSACNSSIFVSYLYLHIGLLPHISKLGFMPTIPKLNGNFRMLDVGASIDVKPNDLYNFAIMANEYVKLFIPNPKIYLLNIATEEHKGSELVIQTNKILKSSSLNYLGYLEANKLLNSDADIVVTDGFSGNIALKAMEGTAKTIGLAIKEEFKKPKNLFKGLIVKKNLKNIGNKFDYKNNAGAIVLGLNKLAIKTHGSADYMQFLSSLKMAYECLKNDLINTIKEKLK